MFQVERRSCSELSCEEFLQYYVETRTPVIITDLVQKITSTTWTLEHVKEVSDVLFICVQIK